MKILFICSTLERTGPTNQLLNIVSNLKQYVSFSILTLSSEKENSMLTSFNQMDSIDLYSVNDIGWINILNFVKSFDIIHSQGIKADLLSTVVKNKTISTLRNYPYDDYPPLYGKILGNLMAFSHLQALRFIDQRVTISDSTSLKNFKKSGLDFSVIYNGVDTHKFKPSTFESINSLRGELKISDKSKVFVFTGPLIERKNVASIIRAFNEKNDFYMIIVGDGPELDYLKSISKSNIIFTGNVSNVQEYLSIADAFVMLSLSEGFPNSVMEALSVGLPCFLSDIPSHRDVERIIGKDVTIIKDDIDLIEVITQFDFMKVDRAAIRKNAASCISARSMALKYYNLYKKTFT